MTYTYSNLHEAACCGHQVPRVALPGEPITIAYGCYVENVGIEPCDARRVANVAYGLGAIDQASFGIVLAEIEAMPEHAGEIADEIVSQLNEASTEGYWRFHDGDLLYSTEQDDLDVCEDCYLAHHYGVTEHEGQWFAGESDSPADRRPLGLIEASAEVTDNTNSETGDGFETFSRFACEGCGSTLGGSRYRLAVTR